MKLDKETIIVVGLCIVLLIFWSYFNTKKALPPPNSPVQTESVTVKDETVAKVQNQNPAVKTADLQSVEKPLKSSPSNTELSSVSLKTLEPVTLSNKRETLVFNPNTGSISEVTLAGIFKSTDKSPVVLRNDFTEGALAISSLDKMTLVKRELLSFSKDSLVLKRSYSVGSGLLELTQTLKLEDDYKVSCRFELKNAGTTPLDLKGFSVASGEMPPVSVLSGDKANWENHDIVYSLASEKAFRNSISAKEADFLKAQTQNPLSWLGASNKYFSVILSSASQPFDGGSSVSRAEREHNGTKYFTGSASGIFKEITLKPGAEQLLLFNYYAGPNEIELLKKLAPGASDVMKLSYAIIEPIAKPLLELLIYLKNHVCGSYGWSIVLLTIIVKLVFWPFTQTANKSMRKMQRLQPEMKKIREKYKEDPKQMNMKVMALYKDNKVNPLGGCLPILLQMPVFIALYSALDASVELRQTPFLWATDLSKPDLVGPMLLFGIGIHPFILMMTGLMVLQQKLTPTMGDPIQQKVMMFMPVIMLVMLYNLPSGLTLYWTVSQGISIIQLLYNLRISKQEEAVAAVAVRK